MKYSGKLFASVLAFTASALALAVACNSGSSYGAPAESQLTTSENGFLAATEDMQSAASYYANDLDKSGRRGDYDERMADDLKELTRWQAQMSANCAQLGKVCPAGGGGSGAISGECMTGGHLMGKAEMDQINNDLKDVRVALEQFWASCGRQWPASCDKFVAAHTREVGGDLARLRGYASKIWSGESAPSAVPSGGMMPADTTRLGPMRWGNCD